MRNTETVRQEIANLKDELRLVTGTQTEIHTRGYNWQKMESTTCAVDDKGKISTYKLFYSDSCPGCLPVKHILSQGNMTGVDINAGTREGLAEAVRLNITGTPTVLFFDESGKLITKAHTPAQIERLMVA